MGGGGWLTKPTVESPQSYLELRGRGGGGRNGGRVVVIGRRSDGNKEGDKLGNNY